MPKSTAAIEVEVLPKGSADTVVKNFKQQLKDAKKEAIANFWDCNSYHISQIGHIEFGTKKISPGGHWIGITGIACKKEKRSIEETALIHAIVAITLHDAFIACWDEKYRSHRVRPETTIREFIDKSWKPMLQTPHFPNIFLDTVLLHLRPPLF